MERVFGIDFGTTSSAVVGTIFDDGIEEIKYGDRKGMPIPSIVAINKNNGKVLTGRDVSDKRQELSEDYVIIPSVKTMLGENKCYSVAGKDWYPEDIACELFKSLKDAVYNRTNEKMSEATVSIPVGFSPEKRDVLRRAAIRAGIHITSFVSEPTSAFFASYDNLKSASTIAVFDWGGGTLDVSVLQNEKGKIYELAKSGRNIAGDYIDGKIAKRIHASISRKKGIEIEFEDMPLACQDKMRVACEQAKIKLSNDNESKIMVLGYDKYGIVNETLNYDLFAEIIQPQIDMAMECFKEAVSQSGVGLANIDRIVLVGGSSKLRPLQETMKREYGDKLFSPESPEWNVGQGASYLALEKGYNYSNQSVGIVLSDGTYYELLGSDKELTNWSQDYYFAITDSSEQAQFVFDGSPDIRQMRDSYRVHPIKAYGFLQEKIIVTASVDENLVFVVKAKSTMRQNDRELVWKYPNLKCYYKLPL